MEMSCTLALKGESDKSSSFTITAEESKNYKHNQNSLNNHASFKKLQRKRCFSSKIHFYTFHIWVNVIIKYYAFIG